MHTTTVQPTSTTRADGAPRPVLSVFDGVMIITGVVIGGGIFALPPMVAGRSLGPAGERLIGADWKLFAFMNHWNAQRDAPVAAYVVTGGLSLALVVIAGLNQGGVKFMVDFTAPVFWFFFLLTGIALFVLRWRQPEVARPFRVPLYPVLPIVFVLTCAFLLYKSLQWALVNQAVQIALYVMAVGLVAWVLARLTGRR